MLFAYIAYIICAYLVGALPYMILLARARGFDLLRERDLHIAMYKTVGRVAGMSGFAVDFFKGIIVVLVGYLLGFPLIVVAAAAVVVVTGQMWPVFKKFDGERGNTTGAGSTILLAALYNSWWAPVVGVIIVAIGFLIRTVPRYRANRQARKDKLGFEGPVSNSFPLAVLIGYASMPIVCLVLGSAWEVTAALALIFALIVVRRLTADVRNDVKEKKSTVKKILFNRFLFDRSYFSAQE